MNFSEFKVGQRWVYNDNPYFGIMEVRNKVGGEYLLCKMVIGGWAAWGSGEERKIHYYSFNAWKLLSGQENPDRDEFK